MVDSVAIRSHQTRRRAQDVFLLWAWLVVALSVVADPRAVTEQLGDFPSLRTGGPLHKLRWNRELTLPLMLLGSFVLSNLISLCLATDLKLGGRFFVITLFMIVSWLTFVGLLGAFQERGLCTLMSGYAFGGAAVGPCWRCSPTSASSRSARCSCTIIGSRASSRIRTSSARTSRSPPFTPRIVC